MLVVQQEVSRRKHFREIEVTVVVNAPPGSAANAKVNVRTS